MVWSGEEGCTPEMVYEAFFFEFGISVFGLHSGANALGCKRKHILSDVF